jgi:thioredoxin 1
VIIVLLIAFIGYFFIKEDINAEKSKQTKTDLPNVSRSNKDSVDFLYNYSHQNTSYKLTFLEFGATTCHECKRMEEVMKEVKEKFKSVNVVFCNVRNNENNNMVEYFGIEMIPVQVLLDKNGKECFRHLGFYSSDSLTIEFQKYGAL